MKPHLITQFQKKVKTRTMRTHAQPRLNVGETFYVPEAYLYNKERGFIVWQDGTVVFPQGVPRTCTQANIFHMPQGTFMRPIDGEIRGEEIMLAKKNPMFVPAWAAKIFGECTDVYRQAPVEMTKEQCMQEGIEIVGYGYDHMPRWRDYTQKGQYLQTAFDDPRDSFFSLLQVIHKNEPRKKLLEQQYMTYEIKILPTD